MDIIDRLKKFKNELGIESNKEMATLLKISESFYSMIESRNKPVSKNVLQRLIILSKMAEEYWRFGITDEKERIEMREEFKCSKDAIVQLSSIGLLKESDEEYSATVKEVLEAAMKADISHILEKIRLESKNKKED